MRASFIPGPFSSRHVAVNAHFTGRVLRIDVNPPYGALHDARAPRCVVCRECLSCNIRPCRGGGAHVAALAG